MRGIAGAALGWWEGMGWRARAALVLGGTLGLILGLVAVGMVLVGRPGPGFAEGRPGTWASVGMLGWGAVLAWRIGRGGGAGVGRGFWVVAAAGLAVMALDDALEVHERAAVVIHRLVGWGDGGMSAQTLDGVLVGMYGVAAGAAVWPRRWGLLRLRRLAGFGAAAGVFLAASVGLDIADVGGRAVEEGLKLMGVACVVCGLEGVREGAEGAERGLELDGGL